MTISNSPRIQCHRLLYILALKINKLLLLFPGHNHMLTTDTDDPLLAGTRVIIKVSGL